MFYTQVGRVRRRFRRARVLDFTCTFYNSRDLFRISGVSQIQAKGPPLLSRSVLSNTVRSHSFRGLSDVAQSLRCIKIMEATQRHPNLLSEKQAAKRLGVARIILLRAREAGRIRFFRIGTRVLYSDEQLADFLLKCERNGHPSGRRRISIEKPRRDQ
jgi:excisionase family DNA binding protein